MARKSTIDKLPSDVRDLIGRLRENGRSIDEILAKLRELDIDVSRSTMGRHVQKIDAIGARLRESRQVAAALVEKFGERDDNRMLQLNIELMMPAIMQLLTPQEDGGSVAIDAKDAMFLSTALQKLASAQAADSARLVKERAIFANDAAKAVANAAKKAGISADTIKLLQDSVLGETSP